MPKRKQSGKTPKRSESSPERDADGKGNGASDSDERRAVVGRIPRERRIDPQRRASAEEASRQYLKERTEEGHLRAGRTPPSQSSGARTSGAHREIDTSIRD